MKLLAILVFGVTFFGITSCDVREGTDKYIYVHIFDGVTVIPSRYSFDARNISSGIRFLDENSSVVMGELSDVSRESYEYLFSDANKTPSSCGLDKYSWVKEGIKSVTIKGETSFIWFAAMPDDDVETSLKVLCESKNV